MTPDDYADQRRDTDAVMRHNFQINDWIVRCAPWLPLKLTSVDVAFCLIMSSAAISLIVQWWA